MKKILICKTTYLSLITFGKEYECIKETPRGYVIRLNTGEITQVSKSRFEVKTT